MNDNSDSSDIDCLVIDTEPEDTAFEKKKMVSFSSYAMGNITTSKGNLLIESGRVEKEKKCSNNIRINVKMDNGSNVRRCIQSNIGPHMNSEISFTTPSAVSRSTCWPPNNFTNVNVFHRGQQNIATTVVNCANNNIQGCIRDTILKTSSASLQIAKPNVLTPNALQSKKCLTDGNLRRNDLRLKIGFANSSKKEKDTKRVRRMHRLKRFGAYSKYSVRTQNGIEKTKNKIEEKKSLTNIKNNVIDIKNECKQVVSKLTSNAVDQINSKIINIKNEWKKGDSELTCNAVDQINSTASVKEKRMIIVDGSNVAFGHGQTNFSVKGIELCLEHFERQGFQVKAICPQMRIKQNQSTDPTRLEVLVRQKKVLLTPCKHLPGSYTTSYDDRFILEISAAFDAAIISNDNFLDLWNQSPEWNNIIEKRVIGYLWCNDKLFLPSDPYGRNGPCLEDILYKDRKTPIETATKEQENRNISFS